MSWTLIGVGVVTAIVAYMLDFVLWTKVFTAGIRELSSLTPGKAKGQMGSMMAKSFANTLVFGIVFALVYARLKNGLWASGVLGGMEFGTILWLLTIAVASIGNGIWLDKVRTLAKANFWAWLIKLNVAGIVVALLIK